MIPPLKKKFKDQIFDLIRKMGLKSTDFIVDNQRDYLSISYKTEDVYFKVKNHFGTYYLNIKSIDDVYNNFGTEKILHERNREISVNEYEKTVVKPSIKHYLNIWLKEVKDEFILQSKFEKYAKTTLLPESKIIITQFFNNPEVDHDSLLDKIHSIEDALENTRNILQFGQEIIFDDIAELKQEIKKENSPIEKIKKLIIGTFVKWIWEDLIVAELWEEIIKIIIKK